MNLTLIAGTNRPGSNTRKVTLQIQGLYQELELSTELLDLAELPPEIFSPSSYAQKPASFRRFSDRILASDGLHVVTPEYNGSVPGILKYFIDMLKFPESFDGRPVCFTGLSAGVWGALRPIEQLQAIFGYRNAHIFPERVFMPGIGNHLSPEGKLTNEEWVSRLKSQARGFVGYVKKLRPEAAA
jgi:chromate reductase